MEYRQRHCGKDSGYEIQCLVHRLPAHRQEQVNGMSRLRTAGVGTSGYGVGTASMCGYWHLARPLLFRKLFKGNMHVGEGRHVTISATAEVCAWPEQLGYDASKFLPCTPAPSLQMDSSQRLPEQQATVIITLSQE